MEDAMNAIKADSKSRPPSSKKWNWDVSGGLKADVDAKGKPVSHGGITKRHFEPALKRAGLRHVSFHSLRHTNASMRIAAGQNIKYIQTQLGHSSIKVTLDVYGHLFVDPELNRRQVRLLESSLGSVRSSDVKTPLLVASSMPP
jgi:integrase